MKSKKEILYITYDGILEPLGQSQVLKYIINSSFTYKIILLSFEKKSYLKNINYVNNLIKKSNVKWIYYTKSENFWFLSKILDLFKIFLFGYNNLKYSKIKIFHCRSYLTTYAISFLKFFFDFTLIFDMRGFWVDERYEWGIWKKNYFFYKILKKIEKRLFEKSDTIIVLANDARNELIKNFNISSKKIYTIPTCADEKQFNISNMRYWKNKLNICHLGSIATRYDLDKTLKFYKKINNIVNSKLLFINKDEHNFIQDKCIEHKIDTSKFEIKSTEHYEVQKIIQKFDFIIFFPKDGFYKKGFFPTKIAESLLSGVPIITSDVNLEINDKIISNKLGILVKEIDKINIIKFLKLKDQFRENLYKKKIRNYAKKYLSITYGVKIYDEIYKMFLK